MSIDRFVEVGSYKMKDGNGRLYYDKETSEIVREIDYMYLAKLPEHYERMIYDILVYGDSDRGRERE